MTTCLRFTEYPSIFDIDECSPREVTWEQLVQRLRTHVRVPQKNAAPGFGPHVLRTPSEPCTRHKDQRPRGAPHRCDACVEALTMAVYDVDVGTEGEILQCDEALARDGIARVWYSSYSYRPGAERPPFRLVLPLAEPVETSIWSAVRRSIAARYQVPADLKRCAGLSHFYYLPSCPPDGEPLVEVRGGRAIQPRSLPNVPVPGPKRTPLPQLPDWTPPNEPSGPVDLEPLRKALRTRAAGLKRRRDAGAQRKGELLQRLLGGEPLGQHGERNDLTTIAAGMVAFTLPGQPLGVLMALFRPSLNAMIAEGSSLTESEVERMLLSSMKSKAQFDERDRLVHELVSREYERTMAAIHRG